MKRVLLYPVLLVLALALTGCALPKDLLANRVSRTLAGDKLLGNSMWSYVGVTSEFHKDDLAAINALLANATTCLKPPTDSGGPK